MEECLLNIGDVSLFFMDTPRVVSIMAGFWGEKMNIWLILFFFVVAIGLVMLFVVGTRGGVAQQITSEDACDPYAPKSEEKPIHEIQYADCIAKVRESQKFMRDSQKFMEDSNKQVYLALAADAYATGDNEKGAYYLSQS